ncbi:hypothetical protein RND71_025324 [Anisodus tanguticus]|uniref:MADS-box domain-containing protein n=1 Tax=Anisodus tanguticus TaxID=243964 RepID=A0AAE1RR65_9SOLA|nr:hypothetical protein RND71_025324 [Anisodus tanguticus]
MARKLNGRKRINIAKMQNKSNLDVTFSKRQVGLFKKASELSILCSAEIATVLYDLQVIGKKPSENEAKKSQIEESEKNGQICESEI